MGPTKGLQVGGLGVVLVLVVVCASYLQVAVLSASLPGAQHAHHVAALEVGVGLIVVCAHHTRHGQGVVVGLVVPHQHQHLQAPVITTTGKRFECGWLC